MREIYTDFNDAAADGSLPLTCAGSMSSIARLDRGLEDGEQVLLSDGDLRAVGNVSRTADGNWMVRPGWKFADPTPES